jgi:ABC-type glycerol-3-phosphate transport system substrate-binding protein
LNGSGNYFYREDVLPSRPENWEDQIEVYEQVDGMAAEFIPQTRGGSFCPRAGLVSAAYMNGAKMCERDGNGEVQIVMDQGDMRQNWVETVEHKVALSEAGALIDPSGDCGDAVQAIPDGVAASNLYGGMRPKIQTVLQTDYGDQVRPMKIPGPSDSTGMMMATVQGLTAFADSNVEAANTYVEFLSQPEYLIDMYLQTPIHNAPLQQDVAQHEDYQAGLNEMPDGWTDEDKQYHLDLAQSADEWRTFSAETAPANPHANNLWSAPPLWRMVHDPVERGADPGEIVDQAAEELRSILEESKEQIL